ncbi:Non-heme chloroperoxidase (plasmid) [Bacillus cereus]|nr:Non-heme chloroperoxidase [Bacillus cereus]
MILNLIIQGDFDATVPFELSGKRTYDSIPDSKLALIQDVLMD